MTAHDLERQRIFSIVAYCDEVSPIQCRVQYVADYGDISLERVRVVIGELAGSMVINQVRKDVYRVAGRDGTTLDSLGCGRSE